MLIILIGCYTEKNKWERGRRDWYGKRYVRIITGKEDDDMLIKIIKENPDLSWVEISGRLKNKFTSSQCNQHYTRVINPDLNKKWDKESDMELMELVEMYGNRWSVISKYMDGKSDATCRGILYNNI